MEKGKFLYTTTIKDYQRAKVDVKFSVYGLFNTEKVTWSYYVISHIPTTSPSGAGTGALTCDICRYDQQLTQDNIKSYGMKFNTKEEGIAFIQEYKDKWEYGSNDTRQERREEKINDVLGDTK